MPDRCVPVTADEGVPKDSMNTIQAISCAFSMDTGPDGLVLHKRNYPSCTFIPCASRATSISLCMLWLASADFPMSKMSSAMAK